jgi:uroporphyrinogen-III synthase
VLCRDRVVGVINVQHRKPHNYSSRETQLISTIGFLVGTEIQRGRLEAEQVRCTDLSEAQKLVEQAVMVLQRDWNCTDAEARACIWQHGRLSGKSMKEIASAVLLYGELRDASR